MRISTIYNNFCKLSEETIVSLYEANLKNLYNKSVTNTPSVAYRARDVETGVRYFGLSEDGTLNFKVKSRSRSGKYHYAFIEAPDILQFGDLVGEGNDFTEQDLSRLLTMNNFRVKCNCESFLYWGEAYLATVGNYEIEPETRRPKRNLQYKDGSKSLSGALDLHLIAVVKNLYENGTIRKQVVKDINNYLRMLNDLDYDDYQQLNHAKQIKQQNRAVKWRNKPSDYMNDYFAHQAKHHSFLDDHDIIKSLRSEVRKYLNKNPDGSIDEFLKDEFNMSKKAFADDMKVLEQDVDDYFNNEIDFKNQQDKRLSNSVSNNEEVDEEIIDNNEENIKQGINSNIV